MTVRTAAEPSRAWTYGFRVLYRILGWLDRPLCLVWLGYGLGNVVQVTIAGRRTGRPRRILLGLLATDGGWYLGHPNGPAQWTRNLDAAGGRLLLNWPGQRSWRSMPSCWRPGRSATARSRPPDSIRSPAT